MKHHLSPTSYRGQGRKLAARQCCGVLSLLFLITAAVPSQPSAPRLNQQRPAEKAGASGAITGRVLSEEGHPLENASVYVSTVGPSSANRIGRSAQTDDEGYFRVADLPPGDYTVSASARGYLFAAANPNERGAPSARFHRPGDSVTITLKKGGVITGKVMNAKGEPVISAFVSATQVRQENDRPLIGASPQVERPTDDRGVYRLYGLRPGSYVIAVKGRGQFASRVSAYDGDAPTFYPSATRESAVEVPVRGGEEVRDIDIRYRGEAGHVVSGAVSGALGSNPSYQSTIMLTHQSSGAIIGYASASGDGNARSFAFYGVADGEYEIKALRRSPGDDDEGAASLPRRITVKGADVTGLQLALVPFGSIAGRFVIAASPAANRPTDCEPGRQAQMAYADVMVLRDREESSRASAPARSQINEQGEFRLRQLEAGRYRLMIRPPSQGLYIRAITRPGPPPRRQPTDVARQGLAIQPGERVEELTITLAEGAAGLRGRVTPAAEGARLPARLRLYLLPAERESADDLLRYAQVNARSDGLFAFINLAPGRYLLVARAVADDESPEAAVRLAAWDNNERLKLRREAAAANAVIELQACQRVSDFALRFTVPVN